MNNTYLRTKIKSTLHQIWKDELVCLNDVKFTNIIENIFNMYENHDRCYHDLSHIDDMINDYYAFFFEKSQKIEKQVVTAIVFHDAFYCSWSKNNESVSAKYAERFLELFQKEYEEIPWAILATTHKSGIVHTETSKILCDLDLLGFAKMNTFSKRENIFKKLRKEYQYLTKDMFMQGRKDFLLDMLSRQIYLTDDLAKFDDLAKNNIAEQLNEMTTYDI